MPYSTFKPELNHCRVEIWELNESEDELRAMLPSNVLLSELDTISHPQKRREWLASRVLLASLADKENLPYEGIRKDEDGKPYFLGANAHISLTHSIDLVAAALHLHAPVGIDLEQIDPKLIRTARKFLSPSELKHAGTDMALLDIYWVSKEAMYKLNGRRQVSFRTDIEIEPFGVNDRKIKGTLRNVDVLIEADIDIFWLGNYCLAVASKAIIHPIL